MLSSQSDIYNSLKSKYHQIVTSDESGYQTLSFPFYELTVSVKLNCFAQDGFDDFCVFETAKRLDISQLYKYNDTKWKEVYEKNIKEDLAEIIVKIEPECKNFIVRTVIHCTIEHYISMIEELLQIHIKFHKDTELEMEYYKNP